MIFDRHVPVIPYHIDITPFNFSRWKIPVARIMDIGLVDRLPIYKKLSVTKFHLLILHGYHTF
jgi:hypothetical protein